MAAPINIPTQIFNTYAETQVPGALGTARKLVIVNEDETADDKTTFWYYPGHNFQTNQQSALIAWSAPGDVDISGLLSKQRQSIFPDDDFNVTDPDVLYLIKADTKDVKGTLDPVALATLTVEVGCVDDTFRAYLFTGSGDFMLKNGMDADQVDLAKRETIRLYSDGVNFYQL